MLMLHSRHFHQRQGQCNTLQSRCWKHFIRHGLLVLDGQNMSGLRLCLMLLQVISMNITRRPQSLLCMSSLCVCTFVVVHIAITDIRILKYLIPQANWLISRKIGQRVFKQRFLLVQNNWYVNNVSCMVYLFISDKYKSLKHATLKWVVWQ